MKTRKKISVVKSIFFIPLLLIIGITIIGNLFIDLYFTRTATKRCEEDLKRLAYTGVNSLQLLDRHLNPVNFDDFTDAFAQGQRFRVTIIDETGEVLGDSKLSKERVVNVENHADRPEIILAKESGVGVSRRYSNTLKIDLLYVAVLYESIGSERFLRVALPLTELKEEITRQRILLFIVGFIALTGFSMLSLIFSRYLLLLIRKSENVLEDRVKERTKHIETLQSIGTQLTVCQSKEEGIKIIRQGALILLPEFEGALAFLRASKDKLEISKTWNGDWIGNKSYSPSSCWALRTGRSYISNPNTEKISCEHSKNNRKKMLCIPLTAQGESYGVLHLSSSLDFEWEEEHYQLAYSIAESASLTLANLELRENLRHQAIRDPLTGLFNRRYLLETFQKELSRSARRKQTLGILMLDLDHFKQFNDQYGHDIGDFILSEFGRIVRMITREEDTPCRYGGEEFTILLPETDKTGAFIVADKIRNNIKKHNFVFQGQSFGPITVSIGASIFPDHGSDIEVLLKAADKALYDAKENGRDQTVVS